MRADIHDFGKNHHWQLGRFRDSSIEVLNELEAYIASKCMLYQKVVVDTNHG